MSLKHSLFSKFLSFQQVDFIDFNYKSLAVFLFSLTVYGSLTPTLWRSNTTAISKQRDAIWGDDVGKKLPARNKNKI